MGTCVPPGQPRRAGYRSAPVATFDQLSAEQRAIVELVLQRGKDYDELSDVLAMPEARVRELARDALVDLAPVSAKRVEEDWRGQLADYVLGQQTGPEATATRGHLRRSEPARTWARSLLDSLDQLYDNGSMPAIPEGERPTRARREPGAPGGVPGAEILRRRRGLAAAGALVAVALVAILLWPIGLLTGDDDDGGGSDQAAVPAATGTPAGAAVVLGQGKQRAVQVQATGLVPSTKQFAYQFWLYDSKGNARSLGAQVTDKNGTLQAVGSLPDGFEKYRYFDLSQEPIGGPKGHSGQSVLRGRIPPLSKPGASNKVTRLGQVVLSPPVPQS
jgi:Anti-sigma-K factor rskA